jgi:hypothetical protein
MTIPTENFSDYFYVKELTKNYPAFSGLTTPASQPLILILWEVQSKVQVGFGTASAN